MRYLGQIFIDEDGDEFVIIEDTKCNRFYKRHWFSVNGQPIDGIAIYREEDIERQLRDGLIRQKFDPIDTLIDELDKSSDLP